MRTVYDKKNNDFAKILSNLWYLFADDNFIKDNTSLYN